jgi:GNAT superfamily N-acetyltransferase
MLAPMILQGTAHGFLLTEVSAAERTARDRLTFDAWGTKLTREQYLDRERLLRQTDHGRMAMHTWALRVSNGVIMASCETFRLPLLHSGAVEVIASVFVDPPLRGARMASRMIEALVKQRREAGLDGLILFSEVGAEIYARTGFRLLPSPTRTWPRSSAAAPLARGIRSEELGEALEWRNRMREGRVDIRLLGSIVQWHLARSEFYAGLLGLPRSAVVGARFGDVQALWVPDYKNNALRVIDATGPAGALLDPIMSVAGREAALLGLERVELWDDSLSITLPGGVELPRDDDLPMGIAFTPRGELFMGPVSRACWA